MAGRLLVGVLFAWQGVCAAGIGLGIAGAALCAATISGVVAISGTLAGCTRAADKELAERRETVAAIEALLEEGDLVFRRGGGLTSRAVLAADRGGVYSHTGIVVRVETEGTGESLDNGAGGTAAVWRIVHIVPGEPEPDGTGDRIKMEPVEQFFAPDRAHRGAVARVAINERGEYGKWNGGAYGDVNVEPVREAARQARRLAATGLEFDHEYNLDDTTRMYCTELIYRAYLSAADFDLTAGRRSRINLPAFRGDYILPSDITGSPYITIIYKF